MAGNWATEGFHVMQAQLLCTLQASLWAVASGLLLGFICTKSWANLTQALLHIWVAMLLPPISKILLLLLDALNAKRGKVHLQTAACKGCQDPPPL
jgi:hypothetical protein